MRTASPPRGIAVGGVVAALALLACGAAPAADPLTAVGDELAVGQNRTGESCRLRLLESHTDRTGFQRFGMFCEGWTQPTGEVRRFAASRDYPAARLLTDSGFQKSFETRVGDCGPVETTALASGTPAALRECRRHDGGWRVLVLAATIDKRNYGLETFPTNLPLLEIAVEILEGRRPAVDSPLTQGSISAAIRRAEAMVDARGTLTGIRDVGAHATFIRLGILRHYQGDYPGSEEAFRRALEIEERVGGRDLPSSGRTIAWIAIDAGYLGRFEEAEQVYDRADPLVRRSSARGDLANYLEQRSSTERLRGRPTVALPLAEEAVRLREQREGLNSEGLAHALVSVGRIQLDLKQLAEAERIVARGLAIVEKPGPDAEFRAYWTAESEEWLGRIHTEQKRFADARAQFEASLARRRLLFGDSIKVADSYRMLGELGRIEGNRPASLAAFRKEAEIRAGDPVARNRARPETIVPYLNALLDAAAATPAEGDALRAEAFAAAQIPREGDTARAITNMAARLDAGDPALGAAAREYQEALRRREAARRELALATLAPADKRDPAREAALGRELESAETAAASREERLQAEFPRYAGLVAPRPLTVGELAGLLRPEEALLSILSTRNATYVFLVRGGRVHAHRAAVNASALDARVRGLR
ncbi:MAG TPA: tetratricopeptide repeat protein, partial [Candidatus Methylomirabilis sp.]|nr:tetratricopeptide repeat protein [Candidatus Methylomirabilis sp.]